MIDHYVMHIEYNDKGSRNRMKRIMVIGISAGVGKSTFARSLGEAIEYEVYHLDALYWRSGWVEAPKEEFRSAQKKIADMEEWIIEGGYSHTYDIRTDRADTVIYLELPLHVCLFRVVKRWFTYRGQTRPDIGEGCLEKIDWAFIKFIWTTYYPRKRNMAERLQKFQSVGPNKRIIELKSKREIKSFLEKLNK